MRQSTNRQSCFKTKYAVFGVLAVQRVVIGDLGWSMRMGRCADVPE
jgi:hypothetical protein